MQTEFNLKGTPIQASTLSDFHLRGIYNSTGNLIPNTTNDDGGTGYNSKLTFTATTSDTYYVSADAYGDNTGTYTLIAEVVAAELGGGKFANGAMSAAFVHLFNAENWGASQNSKCGSGSVSCIATSTGGTGYDDSGRKLAVYKCSNAGGSCSFEAPGEGELVYNGIDSKTTSSLDGTQLYSYHPRLAPFTVNQTSNHWWNFFIQKPYYNQDFMDKLKENKRP